MTDLPMTKAPDDLVESECCREDALAWEPCAPFQELLKERDDLRSQLAAAEANGDKLFKLGVHHQERADAAEAQLQAMRKALEEIANRAGNHGDPDAADWMPSIEKIADEALRSLTEGAGK